MNKTLITSVMLIIVGLVFFGIAGYCFWTLLNVYETLKYYGLETGYSVHEPTVEMIWNLKFGIVQFVGLGVAAWIVGIVFFLKRNTGL